MLLIQSLGLNGYLKFGITRSVTVVVDSVLNAGLIDCRLLIQVATTPGNQNVTNQLA
jgi:hypothetical protein